MRKIVKIVLAAVVMWFVIVAIVALTMQVVGAQGKSATTIVVKDVNGDCWKIVPRTFMYKGGFMAAQNTVVFESAVCK